MKVTRPSTPPGRRRGLSLVEHAHLGGDLRRVREQLWAHYAALLPRYGASPVAMRRLDRLVMALDRVRVEFENLAESDCERRWTPEERALLGHPFGPPALYFPDDPPAPAKGAA